MPLIANAAQDSVWHWHSPSVCWNQLFQISHQSYISFLVTSYANFSVLSLKMFILFSFYPTTTLLSHLCFVFLVVTTMAGEQRREENGRHASSRGFLKVETASRIVPCMQCSRHRYLSVLSLAKAVNLNNLYEWCRQFMFNSPLITQVAIYTGCCTVSHGDALSTLLSRSSASSSPSASSWVSSQHAKIPHQSGHTFATRANIASPFSRTLCVTFSPAITASATTIIQATSHHRTDRGNREYVNYFGISQIHRFTPYPFIFSHSIYRKLRSIFLISLLDSTKHFLFQFLYQNNIVIIHQLRNS